MDNTWPLRLLMVEDMEDDEALLLMELTSGGFNVSHLRVDNEAAMTAALEQNQWDIIISDYSMPRFSGIAALAIAQDRASELPFILVSGTVGEEVAVEAMKAGANDYLFKGNLKRLVPTVQREIRESIIRREAARIEGELKNRDLQLSEAQRLARLGSWVFDVSLSEIVLSSETSRIVGLDPTNSAPSFEAFIVCFHPDDRERLVVALHGLNDGRFALDCRVVCPNGETRFVQISGDVSLESRGARVRTVGVVLDITERKLEEQKLVAAYEELAAAKDAADAASRAKDQFLAILSHELRTPLTPVLLTISLMQKRDDLPHDVNTDLLTIRRHVELEARLIDDLLDMTRISHGKLQLNRETTDAHLLMRMAIDTCCAERLGDITLALNATDHHVYADPARVQQIFWNLLSNANKFTPFGRPIVITTRNTEDGNLQVEFKDSGVGIAENVQSYIFEAFAQGEASLTRIFGGLGLGLAIAKTLVEAHGGTIEAQSEGVGMGSTFTVTLPTVAAMRPKPVRQPPVASVVEFESTPLRVLLVEDHEATRTVMVKLLEEFNYKVDSASSVTTALEFARENEFDLLISDVGLPDGTGQDLLRTILQMQSVDAIAVSGFGMEDDVRQSMEAGFKKHLVKPIDVEKLHAAIQQIVKQKELAQQ